MNEVGFSQAPAYLLIGVGVSDTVLWLVSCTSRGSGSSNRRCHWQCVLWILYSVCLLAV